MSGLKYAFLLLIMFISGCSLASDEGYTSGDIGGVNHTSAAINYVKVNGYGGPNISPFGDGGGYCCIQLPEKWNPELKARIEWEVDPHTAPAFPGYKDRIKFQAWKNALESSFQTHRATVDIPQYGKERCGLTVHFLPCNQVKVTTSCYAFFTPEYPIKEPFDMKEPASCPV